MTALSARSEVTQGRIAELNHVTKHYGDVVALNDVSFELNRGEYVVIVGPSGSGKTTLLHIMGGFEQPTYGDMLIDGQVVNDVPPTKRSTATVFQDYAVFPHMKVMTNVEFGLKMRKVNKDERRARSLDMLKLVGLEGLGDRRPHELSGGQRQRVALARSMVVQPDILLLDEPLGALDAALRRQMQRELKNIQEQVGITFVHVTHDQEEAMNIADRMIVLHQGVIQDQGTPEQIYHRPSSDFSAQFMGDNNFVEGVIAGRQGDMVQIDTAIGNFNIQADGNASHVSGLTIGSQVTFTIRPENVRVLRDEDGKDNIIRNARLKEINFVGSVTNVIAEIDGFGEFKVQLHGMDSLDTLRDQTILLNFDPKDAFLLG